MVTSGTGHDRCPSLCPGPTGARTPPEGSDEKISKTIFGFKRVEKILGGGPARPGIGLAFPCGGKKEPFPRRAICPSRLVYLLLERSYVDRIHF